MKKEVLRDRLAMTINGRKMSHERTFYELIQQLYPLECYINLLKITKQQENSLRKSTSQSIEYLETRLLKKHILLSSIKLRD